jgi:hypothetical protein
MMERNEDRYRFAARPKLHRAALRPGSRFLLGSAGAFLSSGVGRRFLIFRYQTAPGCVVPADRVA